MNRTKQMVEEKLLTISPADSLQAADFCMKTFSYRHLPVVENGQLVGLISQTDTARGIAAQGLANQEFHVRDFMSSPAITVDRHTSLLEAVTLILQNKIGSLVVKDGEEISCILTESDLLKILQRLLVNQEKTIRGALEWNGFSDSDILQTLSFIQYR